MAASSWIYWVITSILTLLVMVAWGIVSRFQRRRILRESAAERPGAELGGTAGALPTAITGFWTSRGASGVWGVGSVRAFDGTAPLEKGGGRRSVRSSLHRFGDGGDNSSCGGCGGCGTGCAGR